MRVFSMFNWQRVFAVLCRTWWRFPLAMLSILVTTILILLEHNQADYLPDPFMAWARMIAATTAVCFTALGLFAEGRGWSGLRRYVVALLGLGVIALLTTRSESLTAASMLLLLAGGLAISFAPYLLRDHDDASIWYFNYQLITGVLFAGLSALVLCGGVTLILSSIEYLFEIDFSHRVYSNFWLFGWIFFVPTYVLARIPDRFDWPDPGCELPVGVRFIQTYLLIPLSLIFMFVLYAYFVKILLQWELPRGQLGKMISAFGVIGVLTHLTIYPVRDRGGVLLGWFHRHFYHMLLLPLVLLAIAIGIRIAQYGVTEARYVVVLCAIWFGFLIGFSMLKRERFRLIHVPLGLVVLLLFAALAGPWRIDVLSVESQYSRLEHLLQEEKLLIANQYQFPEVQPNFATRKAISSMVEYILSRRGADKLRPWFSDQEAFLKTVKACDDGVCQQQPAAVLLDYMGIDYVSEWQTEVDSGNFIVAHEFNRHDLTGFGVFTGIDVKGYDTMIQLNIYQQDCRQECEPKNISSREDRDPEHFAIRLHKNRLMIVPDSGQRKLSLDLEPVVMRFPGAGEIFLPKEEKEKLTLEYSEDGWQAKLHIETIAGDLQKGKKRIATLSGILLLKGPAQ